MTDTLRLIAACGHDLKQPFQAMRLFLHLLQGRLVDPRQVELAERLEQALDAGALQQDQVLTLAALATGTARLSVQAVPLGPLLHRVAAEMAPQAAAGGVTLRVLATSAVIDSDPVLLDRWLREATDNAIRHNPAGTRIRLGARAAGPAHLLLGVLDDGVGMEPEWAANLLSGAERPTGKGRGLGLGLALMRAIADGLGHTLHLDTFSDEGTRLWLRLPRSGMPAAVTTPDATPAPQSFPTVRPLVAVAEDDRLQLAALESLLTDWDYRVAGGAQLAEIMAGLNAMGGMPDLIITDMHLAGGERGPDLVASLRQAAGRPVPALLLTGGGQADIIALAQQMDLTLLHKPVAAGRLRRAIQTALGDV